MHRFLIFIALVAYSTSPATAEEISGVMPGTWKIPSRVGVEQASLLAVLETETTYKICRSRVDAGTTGTTALDLIVDGNVIGNNLVHENSLDDGSCSVVRGKEISLRYTGTLASSDQDRALNGTFVELSDDLRGYRKFTKISTWRYRGTRETDLIHELTLVDLNSSHNFQFCHQIEEVEPIDGFVRFSLVVDGEVLSVNGSDYVFDGTGCVVFAGSKVQLIPEIWSANLSFFRGEGALYLQDTEFTEID